MREKMLGIANALRVRAQGPDIDLLTPRQTIELVADVIADELGYLYVECAFCHCRYPEPHLRGHGCI